MKKNFLFILFILVTIVQDILFLTRILDFAKSGLLMLFITLLVAFVYIVIKSISTYIKNGGGSVRNQVLDSYKAETGSWIIWPLPLSDWLNSKKDSDLSEVIKKYITMADEGNKLGLALLKIMIFCAINAVFMIFLLAICYSIVWSK